MVFSDLEKRALEVFVTSADSQIYAIKHTIPPEVFGAFGSYFSRNPKDFRDHLLDAIKGTISEEGMSEDRDESLSEEDALRWITEKAKDPSLATEYGLKKSRVFFRKWYGRYSHKSIANTVWIPMVATEVSQLFARELAYEQLAFFIEQSTRYVHWDPNKMFLDPMIMKSRHRERFIQTLEELINSYNKIKDFAFEFYTGKNPFEKWMEKQPQNIKDSDKKVQEKTYERQIIGAALDIARFLLPQAAKTNIAWILDARSTEFDIAAWKGHPLGEMRDIAKLIEEHAGQIAPSLLKYTEKNEYYGNSLRRHDLFFEGSLDNFDKGIDVISYDPDSLNKTIAHLLKRHSFGGTFGQKYANVKNLSFKEKIDILQLFSSGRQLQDEWVEMDEEFDLEKVTFEIRTDLGAARDLRRHQKLDRSEPLYTTENGFYVPPMIKDMNPKAKEIFERALSMADETSSSIRKDLPYESQYIVPMATKHAITMSAGLDQTQYLLWTRTTPEGNFSYREDAFNLAEAFVKTYPWVLGYETYPDGPFIEIYKNAPLKNILRLQIGEAVLHT